MLLLALFYHLIGAATPLDHPISAALPFAPSSTACAFAAPSFILAVRGNYGKRPSASTYISRACMHLCLRRSLPTPHACKLFSEGPWPQECEASRVLAVQLAERGLGSLGSDGLTDVGLSYFIF